MAPIFSQSMEHLAKKNGRAIIFSLHAFVRHFFFTSHVTDCKKMGNACSLWYTNIVAVSLFWNTNIAAVMSYENPLYLDLSYE